MSKTKRTTVAAVVLLAASCLCVPAASARPRHPAAVSEISPAYNVVGMFYDRETGRCLDSNAVGTVYTTAASACGFNDLYQNWGDTLATPAGSYGFQFYDGATGRCLDSNAAGKVYTTAASACGTNDYYQDWEAYPSTTSGSPYMLYDYATGRCLDSNAAGKVYTTAASACGWNDLYQNWNFRSS